LVKVIILFLIVIILIFEFYLLTVLLLHTIRTNKKAMEGTMSKEKLRDEIVAPYKQNWIGFFSMVVVILATIVTKFPEAVEIPVIKIPDL